MVSETSSERGSDEEAAIESLYEQDFQALRAECLRNNTLFTDPEFPADAQSLFYSKGTNNKYSQDPNRCAVQCSV